MSTLAFDPEETTHWEQVRPRHISPEQWKKFESYAAEILEAFGMNLDTPGTRATPSRYLHALFESTAGYEGDPKLLTAFPTECHGGPDCTISQVIEGPIEFYSLCEHHVLPFHGHAYRLHRARRDHRHLKAVEAGAGVRAAIHGPGASGRGDR